MHDAMPVLFVQSGRGIYPYMITDGKPLQLGSKSMSANSMVCHTLASISGLLPETVTAVTRVQADAESASDDKIRAYLRNGLGALVRMIVSDDKPEQPPAGIFDSTAFGKDDPFTFTWLVELLRLADREPALVDSNYIGKAVPMVEEAARARVAQALADPSTPVIEPLDIHERPVLHPFPLVRIVQLAHLLGQTDERQLAPAASWFFDRLHLQLSLHGIEYGGFDPAELVFSLEGLMETAPLRVTRPLLASFAACIDAIRKVDPTFRAITPFKATDPGAVHLFASVEVVSSLLRVADKREQAGDRDFFEAIKPALHDYLQWLQATVVTGRALSPPESGDDSYPADTPLDYFGWQSEFAHTGDSSAHIWLTSMVILLLHGYDILLSGSVARTALAGAGLIAEPREYYPPNDASKLRDQATENDPLQLTPESPYRVVSRLNSLFVSPRLESRRDNASYSCLLYGPPGTGKTTLARQVAQQLGWPLLTITTSDFIVDGEAQVEARSKDIFEALNEQRDLVVLFDEIDRLILDRDSTDYRGQGDMLQFMTPSMLTKINNLRRAERVVFMVGTNYADRIDRAIKRAGRIDERLLVLPPDLTRRRQIIKGELELRDDGRASDEAQINDVAVAAAWQTIAEIKSTVHEAQRTGSSLVDAMNRTAPSISLEPYLSRLRHANNGSGSEIPVELLEETFLLVYLFMEGKKGPLPDRYDSLGVMWATRPAGTIRDSEVERVLNGLFSTAAQ
jgi:ATPase family associated with various cellular activities (AAA)